MATMRLKKKRTKLMGKIAVYPGTFDPLTNGHLDLIRRGLKIFDKVIIAVAENPGKHPIFSTKGRVEIIKEVIKDWQNIYVESFNNLLVDYVKEKKADVIIKGLRAVSDFEFEFQMALMNRRLDSSVEAVYMMPSEEYSFVSSRIIKEVARLNGNIRGMVPEVVERRLREHFK